MSKKICNPLTIFHICLSPWNGLDMGGVDQQDLKTAFQKVEDGSPINARTLHGDVGDLMGYQPIMQGQKIRGHGSKGLNLLLHLPSFSDRDTNNYRFFVNIQTRTPTVNDFHLSLLSQLSPGDAFPLKSLRDVLPFGATVRGAFRRPGPIYYGLRGTNPKPTFCRGDNLRKYSINQFSWFAGDEPVM
jgi:hypothetical protein